MPPPECGSWQGGAPSQGWPVLGHTAFPSACLSVPPKGSPDGRILSALLAMGPGWGRPHHNTPGTATYRPTCQAIGAPGGPSKAEESQRTASPTLGLSSHSPHALGQWETQPQNSEPPARAGGGGAQALSLGPAACCSRRPCLHRPCQVCEGESRGAQAPGTDGACQLPEIRSPHAAGTACPLPSDSLFAALRFSATCGGLLRGPLPSVSVRARAASRAWARGPSAPGLS